MIKKLTAAILSLTLILCAVGCSNANDGGGAESTDQPGTKNDTQISGTDTDDVQDGADTDAGPVQDGADAEDGAIPFDEIMGDGRVWKYTDDPAVIASISGSDWTAADYDDGAWMTAEGSFGANEGQKKELDGGYLPEVCLRHYMPDGRTMPTYYFRLAFNVTEFERELPLTVSVAYDDSVVIYLNGERVFSGNTPEDGYSKTGGYGADTVLGEPEQEEFTLDTSLLAEGSNILAVELHQGNEESSDIYFSIESIGYGPADASLERNDTLCLGVGAEEDEMLVSWIGIEGEAAYVEVERRSEYGFTEEAKVFPAAAVYGKREDGTCTYRATITGLLPGEYIYRAVDAYPTRTEKFTVADSDGELSFLCFGDPQIKKANDKGPIRKLGALAEYASREGIVDFIISLGDQSDSSSRSDYFRRFVSADMFKSIPVAAAVGNHEKDSERFSRFFNMPNMDGSSVTSAGDMSGDYWFFRENTLFLCINSNNKDIEEHKSFLKNARALCEKEYGVPEWTIAFYHHSIFSAGDHADDETIIERRGIYPELLRDAGVDVVFSGHDHTYTRSYPLVGQTPDADGDADGSIVYFTLGSSTGTKYYDLYDGKTDYAAFVSGEHNAAVTRVDISGHTMTVTTYYESGGTYDVLDEYTVSK